MHELAVTESIVEIVQRHAQQAGAVKVRRIHLLIGELSSIVDDSVQFYFDFVSQDTLAEGAELVFHRRAVALVCAACGRRWEPADADWACPACQAQQARVIQGREFSVESIEVDEA